MFSCEYCKIFKNIYFEDHLQTAASASWSILYKEFVNISYNNASFGIQEDSIWLQLISFLNYIAFDESNQVKISYAIMQCQGYFLNIALGTRLFTIHLKKLENNYPTIFRLHKISNNRHFEAHLKLLKLHRNMGQAVAGL